MIPNSDTLRITRYAETKDGTFGIMTYNGHPFCLTLEPNDRGNGKNSCVPPGVYICKRHSGTRYKNTWALTDVPNRTAILIHPGNIEDHSLGCILVGSTLGSLKSKMGNVKQAVLSSSNTFNRFMNLTERMSELHLTIVECF